MISVPAGQTTYIAPRLGPSGPVQLCFTLDLEREIVATLVINDQCDPYHPEDADAMFVALHEIAQEQGWIRQVVFPAGLAKKRRKKT